MSEVNVKSIVEAAIFASDDPITVERLRLLFDEQERPEKEVVNAALEDLEQDYQGRGVQLQKVASGYRFQAKADFAVWLQRLWERKPPRYSRAILETLALIAYKQPITRGEIESVRGVAVSSNIVKTLLDRKWVKIIGYREVPGRPALLATTKDFLDYFNLSGLSDLPPLADIKDLDSVGQQFDLELNGLSPVEPVDFVGPMQPSIEINSVSADEASDAVDLAAIAEALMEESQSAVEPEGHVSAAEQGDESQQAAEEISAESHDTVSNSLDDLDGQTQQMIGEKGDDTVNDALTDSSIDHDDRESSDKSPMDCCAPSSAGDPSERTAIDKGEVDVAISETDVDAFNLHGSAVAQTVLSASISNESSSSDESGSAVNPSPVGSAAEVSHDDIEKVSQDDFVTLVNEMKEAASVSENQDVTQCKQEQEEETVIA